MSFGFLALAVARTMRHQHHGTDKWLFGTAGAASVGFALAFLALVTGWVQLERRPFHPSFFLWLCLFFGFSAIGMLGMALRMRSFGPSESGPGEVLSPLGNPGHAH
jgi:purine-cytosine permease-like protein